MVRRSDKHQLVYPNREPVPRAATHLQTDSEPAYTYTQINRHTQYLGNENITIWLNRKEELAVLLAVTHVLVNDAFNLHGLHDISDELGVCVRVSDLLVK